MGMRMNLGFGGGKRKKRTLLWASWALGTTWVGGSIQLVRESQGRVRTRLAKQNTVM